MKKYLFMAIMALVAFTSCQKDDNNDGSNTNTGSTSNTNSIIGEWKATKIVATFNDGSTWSTTNFEELSAQLEELEWFIATEHHIQPKNHSGDYDREVLIPYSISNNHIVFTGAESNATYYLQSVTKDEMIIKYTKDWTSLIYYNKVKE